MLSVASSRVRALPLDEPGDDLHVTHREDRLALAEADHQVVGVAEEPADDIEGPRRHQDCLVTAEDAGPGQVAHGESVGVGGHEPQAVVLGGEEDTGEDGTAVVAARRGHDLVKCRSDAGRREGDLVTGRRLEPWELLGCQRPKAEVRASGADAGAVVADLHLDLAAVECTGDVGRQLGRHDGDAVLLAADLRDDANREVAVAACHRQHITGEVQVDATEHLV